MNNAVNRVQLIGYLGNDPDIRFTSNNVKVARFRLATTENWKKLGEKQQHTEWHSIVVFDGLSDIVEKFLEKGSKILLEGRLRTRTWMNENAEKNSITEVFADTVLMLDNPQNHQCSCRKTIIDDDYYAA